MKIKRFIVYTICGKKFILKNEQLVFQTLTAVLEKDSSLVIELYYAVNGLASLGQKLPDTAKIVKNLQAALKKDDSISR